MGLNGSKMWCTNASIADFIVTAGAHEPGGGAHSLSLIVVPTRHARIVDRPAGEEDGFERLADQCSNL